MESNANAARESVRDSLFDKSPLPSWVYDPISLRFLAVNQAALEYYGYSDTELLELTLADIRPPEEVPLMREALANPVGPVHNFGVWHHRRRDGTTLNVRVVTREIEFAGQPARLAVMADSEEHVAAERALARFEDLFQNVWDKAIDPMRITDGEGTVLRVNAAYCRFAGSSKEELEHRPFWIIYPEERQSRAGERYRERFRGGTLNGVADHEITLRNGRRHCVQLTNSPLYAPDGDLLLTVWRDVTQQKDADDRLRTTLQELERARQMSEAASQAKSVFLANMSHEIRTPMNGILGLAGLLEEAASEDERRSYVKLLKSSAEGLMTVLNDVLDLSKIEAGQMTAEDIPFALKDCVENAAQALMAPARKKGIELSFEVSSELPAQVAGDPARVRQILVNLIGNAIKFTSHGFVRVSAEPSGKCILLRVADSGIGIAEEQHQAVFEPFQQGDVSTTRTHGGTGLGLSIVSELVKLMGGRIALESRPGVGTTVRVELPLRAVCVLPGAGQDDAGPTRSGLRILVAEDNAVNQLVTSRLLEQRGHHVTLVGDGHAAVIAVTMGAFDVVLMDVQMPVMDGLEATRAIRAAERPGRRLPIVALTAHAMRGDEEALLRAGMDAYVSKPVRAERLFAAIAACCG